MTVLTNSFGKKVTILSNSEINKLLTNEEIFEIDEKYIFGKTGPTSGIYEHYSIVFAINSISELPDSLIINHNDIFSDVWPYNTLTQKQKDNLKVSFSDSIIPINAHLSTFTRFSPYILGKKEFAKWKLRK